MISLVDILIYVHIFPNSDNREIKYSDMLAWDWTSGPGDEIAMVSVALCLICFSLEFGILCVVVMFLVACSSG